jgi:hypothetical protein
VDGGDNDACGSTKYMSLSKYWMTGGLQGSTEYYAGVGGSIRA